VLGKTLHHLQSTRIRLVQVGDATGLAHHHPELAQLLEYDVHGQVAVEAARVLLSEQRVDKRHLLEGGDLEQNGQDAGSLVQVDPLQHQPPQFQVLGHQGAALFDGAAHSLQGQVLKVRTVLKNLERLGSVSVGADGVEAQFSEAAADRGEQFDAVPEELHLQRSQVCEGVEAAKSRWIGVPQHQPLNVSQSICHAETDLQVFNILS